MLNMQNVKDIEITEGDVRTIHDKDSRLIWGRLAYDTKYAGDTTQNGTPTPDAPVSINVVTGEQTVTIGDGVSSQSYEINLGKNLWSPTPYKTGYTINSSGVETVTANGSIWELKNVSANTTFTISLKNNSVYTGNLRMHAYTSTGSWIEQVGVKAISANTSGLLTFTTPANTAFLRWGFWSDVSDSQLELGSAATPYAPYFTPIELCKIGTYQDYIYKSGDDWYVHKEFGKYIFNGTETIAYNASNHGFTINPTNLANYLTNLADPPLIGLCTHFKVNTTTTTWVSDNTVGLSSAGTFWCKATGFANSQSDCETWLTSNTPTIYYGLATPTDTKITDATLLGQLDAIHEWLTRYGYSSTVTGNLPIIINQTNL